MTTQILILLVLLGGFKLSTCGRNGTQSACTICKCSSSKKDSNLIDIDCIKRDLSDDNLPVFPRNTLSLSLQYNKLTRLKRKYFQYLPKLQKLDVSRNPITTIDEDAFYDLKEHLLTLNVKGYNKGTTNIYFNKIFPAIGNLANLRELTMHIQHFRVLGNELKNLTNLTKIDISESGLDLLDGLWPLQYLPIVTVDMRNSYVIYTKGTLKILLPKLQILDLSYNRRVGQNFPELISDIKTMNVSTLFANYITAEGQSININETVLQNINNSKLENLHLIGNYINWIDTSEHLLRKLNTFSISLKKGVVGLRNRQSRSTTPQICREFNKGWFYRPFGAKKLIIKNELKYTFDSTSLANIQEQNDYTRTTTNMSEYITRLQNHKQFCRSYNSQSNTIHCMENVINHIQLTDLNFETIKTNYDILKKIPLRRKLAKVHRRNVCVYIPMLRRVDVFNFKNLGEYLVIKFIGLQYVEHMRLEHSDIKQINYDFMSSFENLITLSLPHNDIGDMLNDAGYDDISSIALNSLPKLEVLDLSWNRIERLPIKFLSKQSKLKTLIMQHNKLHTLDIDMKHMSSLDLLDLSHNMLKKITSENMANLDRRPIITLLLKGNILQCSCDYDVFLNWLKITSVTIPDQDSILCGSATSIEYVSKWDSKTCHYSMELSIVYILLGTLGPLFIIAVCICLKFNNWLKYRFHLLKWRITKCKNIPNGFAHINNNSVFISYSHGDRDWIWRTLKVELESMGYKPFIHEIDFEIGQYIADNIVNAIHRCSKTIIILSDNFFESQWCMFELQMALVKGIDCIVPIQLSELTKKNKTLLLRYLSRTHGEWPPNDVGLQKNFWKHLKRALDRAAPISEQAGFIENEANDTDEEDSV